MEDFIQTTKSEDVFHDPSMAWSKHDARVMVVVGEQSVTHALPTPSVPLQNGV
jgi:hypothetical protein